jgi:hypothetical protein
MPIEAVVRKASVIFAKQSLSRGGGCCHWSLAVTTIIALALTTARPFADATFAKTEFRSAP